MHQLLDLIPPLLSVVVVLKYLFTLEHWWRPSDLGASFILGLSQTSRQLNAYCRVSTWWRNRLLLTARRMTQHFIKLPSQALNLLLHLNILFYKLSCLGVTRSIPPYGSKYRPCLLDRQFRLIPIVAKVLLMILSQLQLLHRLSVGKPSQLFPKVPRLPQRAVPRFLVVSIKHVNSITVCDLWRCRLVPSPPLLDHLSHPYHVWCRSNRIVVIVEVCLILWS